MILLNHLRSNGLHALVAWLALMLAGCGMQSTEESTRAAFVASQGQVVVRDATPLSASHYAASRFLEQASWGPSPDSVQKVMQLGMEKWIDQQLLVPASTLNAPESVRSYDINADRAAAQYANDWRSRRFYDLATGGADQLRQRMSWALYNYIPVNVIPYPTIEYFNTLQKNSLGSYKDLLRAVSLSPSMGTFLNNDQNTASRPNENYARELMQLFSVGLVLLNPDGSVQRDSKGAPLETYTQRDVVQATRALSGWNTVHEPNLPNSNWMNAGKPMTPRSWPPDAHDSSAKTVLGRSIAQGQTPQQDLDSLLDILVNHPNTAPFVSKRLIQSMVSSNPSPQYIERVGKVFRDSGGDLGKVARAILLDPEAREADQPARSTPRVGKIKEPILHHTNLLRALGCKAAVMAPGHPNEAWHAWSQRDYSAPNVFGYVSPTYKTPETLVPAPEQKLLSISEIDRRLNSMDPWDATLELAQNMRDAGCDIDSFLAATQEGDERLLNLISTRMFRGGLSPVLRQGALNIMKTHMTSDSPWRKFTRTTRLLLATPSYGVVR